MQCSREFFRKTPPVKIKKIDCFFVFFRFKIETLKTSIFSFFESKNIVEFCPKRERAPENRLLKCLLANILHENPRIEKVKKNGAVAVATRVLKGCRKTRHHRNPQKCGSGHFSLIHKGLIPNAIIAAPASRGCGHFSLIHKGLILFQGR